MTFRPLPVLTGLTLVSLAILLWLGAWQWGRFVEKRDMDAAPPPAFEQMTLYRVPQATETQEVYGLYRGQAVWRRYVAVSETPQGPAAGIMLFDMVVSVDPRRQDVSDREAFRADYLAMPPEGKRGIFSGKDDPENGLWFVVSASRMLDQWGIENRTDPLKVFEPRAIYSIDFDRRFQGPGVLEAENPWADPRLADELPPARHMGYALTWWGFALTLIGVYIAFHMSQGRLSFRRKGG